MIALDSDLLDNFIKIFIKKESITIDNSFQNFIKHLRLPVVISIHQKEEFKKPAIAKQQGNLFRIVRATDDRDLSKKAKLRIILSDRYSYFPYINFIHRNFSNHDRYINIYKKDRKVYEIILSSGIFNILNPDKDITYVVRVF